MDEGRRETLRVDLCASNGSWHVVVEQEGQRRELGGLGELIRYLQGLAGTGEVNPVRGVR